MEIIDKRPEIGQKVIVINDGFYHGVPYKKRYY